MPQLQSKSATESGKSSAGTQPPTYHPAFRWQRSVPIGSLNLVVEEYVHDKTGALHYHLAADNPENVFLVALRTVPMDSTGVAHILEHTALCGSKKYPVRDPFFMMIRRSLNTFMNAFTSSDWTAYPFASQNKKDFNNLLDVYLDAVFFARLDALDFAQEGHRLEFAEADNPQTDLIYKGVVFNEMKGAMSSTVSSLWQTLTEHLFTTSTYHYNSGGEPADIPNLSYEALKTFYKTHYHPSNAIFMTYGDIPAHEHQSRFENEALRHFDRLDKTIEVGDEVRFDMPRTVSAHYALDEVEAAGDKTHIVMGWLLGKSTDAMELMKAHLVSSVLLDNGASPLRHALETTGLGAAPSPLCGLEDSNREMSFMCGLEGSKTENAGDVEALVLEVLEEVASKGVPSEQVEAVLHQLELSQREIKGDGYPYGLQLILEGLSPAIHRGDPVALLNLDPVLDELRESIKNSDFIKMLVRELLIDNPHRVLLTYAPDTGLAAKKDAAERVRLANIKAGLDAHEKQAIIEQAEALKKRQMEEDDPEILPKVDLADVPHEMKIAEGVVHEFGHSRLSYYAQGTNGIVYQQLIAKLPALNADELQLMPHYTRMIPELGSGGRDYLGTQALIDAVTGGIHASATVRGAVDDVQSIAGHFVLSGKALHRKHVEATALLCETMASVRFDEVDRIRELIAQDRARAEQGIPGNGHVLAMNAAASGMSPAAALSHSQRGLAGIRAIKALDDSLGKSDALNHFASRLASVHAKVLTAPREFLLISEQGSAHDARTVLENAWRKLEEPHADFAPLVLDRVHEQIRQMWITSTQVNFCAKAYPTVPIAHDDAPALAVLGGFLRNGYLHRAIREQGGAYGGGAGHDADIAAFRFYSYRDPRLAETLHDFDASIEWLLSTKHEPRQLEEAILGVIGGIDKPGSPSGEAKKAFHSALYGRTPDLRRDFRSRVLGVTIDDLRRVGETYLVPDRASIAVISNTATHEAVGNLGLEVQHV